jgi:hypothetical protein
VAPPPWPRGGCRGPQLLSALNFGALLVHQYEEYEDPGWFPGQFNHGVLKSDQPRNYPLNQTTALCVNTVFAYPFYIAPVLFPKNNWLGLAPAFFGIMQAGGHGVVFPRIAGDNYSPGFLASFFLHIPLGVSYIRALKAQQGLTGGDLARALPTPSRSPSSRSPAPTSSAATRTVPTPSPRPRWATTTSNRPDIDPSQHRAGAPSHSRPSPGA